MNETKIEMQSFTYPLFFRIVFKYGNFFITTLLMIYSIPLILYITEKPVMAIPLLVNVFLIYFMNKRYIENYKILPFKIEADSEKLICTNFFLSKKEVVIYYHEINSLTGGSFENKKYGIMKLHSENKYGRVGFYNRLNNSSRLVSLILSRVKKPLYDRVMEHIIIKKG